MKFEACSQINFAKQAIYYIAYQAWLHKKLKTVLLLSHDLSWRDERLCSAISGNNKIWKADKNTSRWQPPTVDFTFDKYFWFHVGFSNRGHRKHKNTINWFFVLDICLGSWMSVLAVLAVFTDDKTTKVDLFRWKCETISYLDKDSSGKFSKLWKPSTTLRIMTTRADNRFCFIF